jgi:type II secretory pathway pseudopilin PulG
MIPDNSSTKRRRSGFTSTEVVVAASLLAAAMGIVGPLAVQTTRLAQDSRQQRLALDELSDQIERLTALDPPSRSDALQQLQVSEALSYAAPEATIQGETLRDADGVRLVLTLQWNHPSRPRAPVQLVGWLDPLPQESSP